MSLLLVCTTGGDQRDLLTAKLDLELIAGLEIKQGGVGLADQQIAVALHGGGVAELAATFAATHTVVPQAEAFGLEQSLIEGGEVQPLAAILLGAYVAAAAH
jgi:hypothetical protein